MINPFVFSSRNILHRLEYHYGRDSSLYRNYRDYINIRNKHHNQELINSFVLEHNVNELTVYPYFPINSDIIKDAYGNDIPVFNKGYSRYYLPFTLIYKKLGEFDSRFLLSQLYPSRYKGFSNIAFTRGSCDTKNDFPEQLLDSSNHKPPYSETIMGTAYYSSPKQLFDFGEVIYLPYRYISHREQQYKETLSNGTFLDLIECDKIEYTHIAYVKYYPEFSDLHDKLTLDSSENVYIPPSPVQKTCCLAECFGIKE